MAKYPFLSDNWMDAARGLREEYKGKIPPVAHQIKMNLVITDVPGRDGPVEAHMDSSSGDLELEMGHIEAPELTVTLDAATAKAIFIEGNPQAGMQAFMAGKVKIQGDMTKLMVMQSAQPDPMQVEMTKKLADLTE